MFQFLVRLMLDIISFDVETLLSFVPVGEFLFVDDRRINITSWTITVAALSSH